MKYLMLLLFSSVAIASTPALIAERYDSGSVILFAENTNFRCYW